MSSTNPNIALVEGSWNLEAPAAHPGSMMASSRAVETPEHGCDKKTRLESYHIHKRTLCCFIKGSTFKLSYDIARNREEMDIRRQELMGLQGLIMRAKGNPDRSGSSRRATLERLLSLAHATLPDHKLLAARNIPSFITDFPALEEQAINAVYDLCEDPSSEVRIEGYQAISEISRANSKLVKRNADVLLQLLQSDEPEEVSVVKKALIEHIQMGSAVTLAVLCDQLSPTSDEMDDEEKSIRERLRSLVINFLLEDGREAIIRNTTAGSLAEAALLEGLQTLVPHLDLPMTQRVVKELLFKLPVSPNLSARGEPLLVAFLDRASAEKTGKPSLSTSQPYLELAQELVLRRTSHPLPLLRYYSGSLTGRLFLQQLSRPERLWILNNLADLLAFCHQHYHGDQSVQEIQWKIADGTPVLLEILFTTIGEKKSGMDCIVLLRNLRFRKQVQPSWAITTALHNILTRLKALTGNLPPQENKRELQTLLMHLLPSANAQGPSNTPKPNNQVTGQTTQPALRRAVTQPLQPGASNPQSTTVPPTKKRKSTSELPEVLPRVSLLNRLQSSTPEPPRPSPVSQPQGLSIRGAASLVHNTDGFNSPQSAPSPAPKTGGHSLLARLQGVDFALTSSDHPEFRQPKRRRK